MYLFFILPSHYFKFEFSTRTLTNKYSCLSFVVGKTKNYEIYIGNLVKPSKIVAKPL